MPESPDASTSARRRTTGVLRRRSRGQPPSRRGRQAGLGRARRRPTRGCGRPAGRAGPRRPAGRASGVSTSWMTPGSPRSTSRVGTPPARSSMTSGGIRSGATARERVEVAERQRGPASRARPARPAAGSVRASMPCASMSDVIVSGPTQVIRAGQMQHRGRVARPRPRASSAPRTIWPTGPASAGAGSAVGRLGAGERRGDGAVRVGRHDDDRQRAAGPGDVGEPPDPRLALGVGEGALGGGGQDHGGDGHRPADASRSRCAGWRLPRTMCDTAPPHDRPRQSAMPAAAAPRPRRPAQRRDRRPRRPRQDHARRRDAPPDRRVPREPGRRRPRHGLGRPRAREGHHDPRQADDGRLRRRPPEHRRHARATPTSAARSSARC